MNVMRAVPRKAYCLIASVVLAAAAVSQTHGTRENASSAARLHEAIVTAQHGDAQHALTLTQQLLADRPMYEPALKFEGALLQDAGYEAEAQTFFEKALQLAPTDPELLFSVGVARLRAGKYTEAAELLARGAKLNPRDSEMFYYLAQAEHLSGHDEPALAASKRSVELDSRNPAMLQKYGELLSAAGNNAEAQVWLHKARELDPSLQRINLDLGLVSLRNEDLDAAASYAAAAAAKQPEDSSVMKLQAEIDVKLGRWADAKGVFTRLLAKDPNDASARLELGHSELALKEYQEAVNTLEQVVREAPATMLAHFFLARAYAGLGMTAEAAHETELHNQLVARAGSVVPRDEREVEKATLLEARQMLTDGHEQQAVALFRSRAKGPNATAGEPYMLVGVSYLYMDRLVDARRCLEQALAVEPTVRDAHTYLGILALRQQDLPAAESQFDIELQNDPNSQLAAAELGEVRYRQDRWADAADQITRSRTVAPAMLYMLSDADFHLGRVSDANLAAELAIDYVQDDPSVVARVLDLLKRNGQHDVATKLSAAH